MPWKTMILAFPVIMAWSYWDIKTDILELEQSQIALEEAWVEERISDAEKEAQKPVPQPSREPERFTDPAKVFTVAQPRQRLEIVRTNGRVSYKKLDVFCLAKNIFHEAGIENDLGKYAVAQVTLNRMRNPKYPTTVCEVVMDPFQFSWANDRSIRWTRPKGRNWEQSVKIAENVLIRGYRVRGLERANYYHADYVRPRWKKPEAKIAQIGTHIFYASAR
jgi:spore germination cell wall hydrolase CwlJ-like protein